MSADDFVNTTIEELQKVLLAKSIVGDPIEMEDKIVLPISKVGLGFGSGSKKGSENKKAGNSEGAGGGMGILPVAVVIVFKGVEGPEGIKVVPLAIPGAPVSYWSPWGRYHQRSWMDLKKRKDLQRRRAMTRTALLSR